jgi:hypothetical protein
MNGKIDPEGCLTTATFEYRKKGSGESWSPSSAGSYEGQVPVAVQGFAGPLQPETTYEFRLKASSNGGTDPGSTLNFTTQKEQQQPPQQNPKAPTVTNEAASAISSSGATLNASVNPNESSTTYHFEYGTKESELKKATAPKSDLTGSTSQKVNAEVSLEPATKYYFRASATNAINTTTGTPIQSFTTSASPWKLKETPKPEGAEFSNFQDVSCMPSTSACTAVGNGTSSGVDSPLAYRWNGSSWSAQVPAKKTGAVETRLFGVDCPSETRCLAVGSYELSEGEPTLMAEIWNENKWSNQTTPTPTGATSSEFRAIGCNSTATCTAVGSALISGVKTAIAERWTSPTWALSPIPIPEGAKSSQLDGVDCLWSNFCVAVGQYTNSGGFVKSLAMFWNGTEWKLQTLADPEGAQHTRLHDVSCTPSPNRCTVVGSWNSSTTGERTLAYRFNGSTTWTLQSTPHPPGGVSSVFQEVSCSTETACAAVGIWREPFGEFFEGFRTLAANWNGSSWSIQGTPNPAGAFLSSLFGVSCQSSTCYAVGTTWSSPGGINTLGLFRE